MTWRLSILAILLSAPGIVSADPDADFARANQLFESGDYAGAKSVYETIARDGKLSPDLYFNLGAASHRAGHSGEGVLWMRRALVLDPGMAEVRQSLTFLQGRIGYLEFSGSRLARFIAALPPGFGPWTVSLCIWFAGLAVAGCVFIPRLRGIWPAFAALAFLLLAVAIVAQWISHYRETRLAIKNFATVLVPETQAFTAPAPDAKKVIDLPPGTEVRLLQRTGPWDYVEIPGDLRGWVRSDRIESVWPIPQKQTHEEKPGISTEIPRAGEPPLPVHGKGGGA